MRRFRNLCLALAVLFPFGVPACAGQPGEIADGTAALYRGDYRRAAAISHQFVQQNPLSAPGRILLAQVLMAFNRHDQAFSELREALRLEPDNADALYFLGKVTMILGQLEFERLRQMAPDSARVHQLMGESLRFQNNNAEAEKEFLAALKAAPKSVEVLNALGDLMRAQLRYEEASTYYSRAAAVDPNDYDSVYGLGACALQTGQTDRAIDLFRKAAAIDPDSAAAHFALGLALRRNDKLAEAAAALKKAVTIEPRMHQGFTTLGRVYQELGRQEEAREAFRRARELFQAEMAGFERRMKSSDLIPEEPPPAEAQEKP